MNIRKNIDYSEMHAQLDKAMAADMSQMELYSEIGKIICRRAEKGAAVAAAAYLSKQYPDVQGFSPRNLRRMRDFYRSYENHPTLLTLAMQFGWTQNVIILEAELSTELREWYLKAASQFGWSKVELIEKIAVNAHETIDLPICEEVCYSVGREEVESTGGSCIPCKEKASGIQIQWVIRWTNLEKIKGRRWLIIPFLMLRKIQVYFMRC